MLWRFVNGRQDAYCLLQPHPTQGLELRYFFNGVQLIGIVSPDVDELQERSQEWRNRLLSEGWLAGERKITKHQGSSGSVRVRRAAVKA
jgi:hypothetical protein